MTTALEVRKDPQLTIGGRTFRSRLMVGTGKYRDNETMAQAIAASGAATFSVGVTYAGNLSATGWAGLRRPGW